MADQKWQEPEHIRLMKELARAEEQLRQAEESVIGQPVNVEYMPGQQIPEEAYGHFTPEGMEKVAELKKIRDDLQRRYNEARGFYPPTSNE